MNTPDTTVLVAAFSRWHEHHLTAREALDSTSAIGSQVALECFSVLTRMPAPLRSRPDLVIGFLKDHFPGPKLTLSAQGYDDLLDLALAGKILGGAIYDALVAATVREAGMTLVSLDIRAAPTYRLIGVQFEMLM